jgi:hypothetical protein
MEAEEQDAINELKAMSREELDNVEFTLKKWVCQCKGCTRGTTVRDYGISPEFYWPSRGRGWRNLNFSYFMCGKHYPFMKKMEKIYGWQKVEEKMIDFSKMPIDKMIDMKFEKSNKLNK